jgi:adenine C2-methylase RlmN of 23S rRNA A2503 and tRNA A37
VVVMCHPGVNDGAQQAHELGALLQGRAVVVNLIPWWVNGRS